MTGTEKLTWVQRLLAAPFLVLGGWCLVAPRSVETLVFSEQYRHLTATSAVMIGCFGAQAVLSGLFIVLSNFPRRAYLGYGIALLPFFYFNYYFVYVVPMFNKWMAIDFVSNLLMLGLCFAGYRLSSAES